MLAPLLVASLVALQAPAGPVARLLQPVSAEGTRVTVRTTEPDEAVNDQVRRLLPAAIRAASRWGALPPEVELTVHATHAGLEDATQRAGSPWMRAWTRPGRVDLQSPRTWSRGRASDAALTQILSHELTHCALFAVVGRDGRADEVPLWFLEGMATVAAGEHHDLARADALTNPAPVLRTDARLVYGTADRAFRELVSLVGDAGIRKVMARLAEGRAFAAAFHDGTGLVLADFEGDVARRLAAVAHHGPDAPARQAVQ